jgi:glycosyltransferase involved in cell wall biosynthesis
MSPLVSVLLPYREAADTVEEALESVLAQRGVGLEVLAIDDGSTDAGPARVGRLAARDPRIVPVATGGVGLVRALCDGLARARAPFVARMDADDVCRPDRLAAEVEALRARPDLGAVGCRVEAFPAEAIGPGMARYVAWQNSLLSPEDHAREIFVESPLCHPSVMIRRDALADVGPWRETGGPEDYDLWLRFDERGWRLAKVPEVLLRWRQRPGRATFADPRYAVERFREAKAPHLARRLRSLGRPVAVWGAGPTGKRLARALEPHGVRADRFVDVDPRKVGSVARGAPILAPRALARGEHTVVVAVGARGAREEVRTELAARGFVEGDDFLCAA